MFLKSNMKKNNNKKPTVTIAVSIYNEEKNIKKFLSSLLTQAERNYTLEKILLILDGCTDKTYQHIKTFKDKRLHIISHDKRKGKSSRLNEIYKKLTSNILVQTDADVILAHNNVVEKIIYPLVSSPQVIMTCGKSIPIKGKSFTEEAINCAWEANSAIREKIDRGNHPFSVDGKLLAYKKSFIRNIVIPSNIIGNDRYTYYTCLLQGKKCTYVPEATVNYRSPKTLKDHINQNTRFFAIPYVMMQFFPKTLIKQHETIPFYLGIKEKTAQFMNYPFHSLYIFLVNRYCHIKAYTGYTYQTAKWEVATTTKKLNFL